MDEREWPEMKNECCEEDEQKWVCADMKVRWLSELCICERQELWCFQWTERIGVVWQDLGALTTVRATEFWVCCRQFIWELGLSKKNYNNLMWIERWQCQWQRLFWNLDKNAKLYKNMIIVGFGERWDLVWKGEVFVRDEAKVPSRVGCVCVERGVVYFSKLLFVSDEE